MQVQINKTVKQVCLLQTYIQTPTLLNRFAWKRLAMVQTDPQQLLVVAFSFMLHYSIAPDLNPSETATEVVLQSKSPLFFTLFGLPHLWKVTPKPKYIPAHRLSLSKGARQRAGTVHRKVSWIFRPYWGSTFRGSCLLQVTWGHHESLQTFRFLDE